MCLLAIRETYVSQHPLKLQQQVISTIRAKMYHLPASSRLSSLTLEASDTLLSPLRSHGQQLGDLTSKTGLLASDFRSTATLID